MQVEVFRTEQHRGDQWLCSKRWAGPDWEGSAGSTRTNNKGRKPEASLK